MAQGDTATRILTAARTCLLRDGYAAMSTRKVAEEARVPLSQIHYHYGSRDDLILSLLRADNERLLERQRALFSSDIPLSELWSIACDYLDEDVESGYVRVLQEMMAAGWSSDLVGKEMRQMLEGWNGALYDVAERARSRGTSIGGLTPEEVAALVSSAFLGAESMLLLGMESDGLPLRRALRKVGELIGHVDGGGSE